MPSLPYVRIELPSEMINKPWPERKGAKTLLVCGAGPCVIEDFKIAREQRPTAKVMAIKSAAEVIWADYMATYHPEERVVLDKDKSLNPNIFTFSVAERWSRSSEEAKKKVDIWV